MKTTVKSWGPSTDHAGDIPEFDKILSDAEKAAFTFGMAWEKDFIVQIKTRYKEQKQNAVITCGERINLERLQDELEAFKSSSK